MINRYLKYPLFIIVLFLLSCDKHKYDVGCDECFITQPAEIKLIITFDVYQFGMFKEPVITVYEGNIEDSLIVARKTASVNPTYISVYIDKRYTVTATYYYFNYKTYTAIDVVVPRVVFDSDKCHRPCYFPVNSKVNLTLKYTR